MSGYWAREMSAKAKHYRWIYYYGYAVSGDSDYFLAQYVNNKYLSYFVKELVAGDFAGTMSTKLLNIRCLSIDVQYIQ